MRCMDGMFVSVYSVYIKELFDISPSLMERKDPEIMELVVNVAGCFICFSRCHLQGLNVHT